jgi:hypothetical protein
VIRETQWLVEVTPVTWGAWERIEEGGGPFMAYGKLDAQRQILIRQGEPPQVYAKRDFAPGCTTVQATMWRLEDGKPPEMLAMPGGEPGPFLSTGADTFGLQDDKTGEWIFRVTCG